MMLVLLRVVGVLAATFLAVAAGFILAAIKKRLWYARKRIAIAKICREEITREETRRGLMPPPRTWAITMDFEEGEKPLIFLHVRGESARCIVDSVIPRLRRELGVNDYSFVAGPAARASADAHFGRPLDPADSDFPIVSPAQPEEVFGGARQVKRPAPGRKLAIVRWFCGAETRDLIDMVRTDLARDRREMEAEGRSPAFIWLQQTVVEWREIIGIAYRFVVRFTVAANPLARLIDRQ